MSYFDSENENRDTTALSYEYGLESGRPAEEEPWYPDYKKHWEDLYNFDRLSSILENGQSRIIQNKELGEISIDKGLTGKNGFGLLHIIEDRTQEGRNDEETTAIIHLVTQAAKEGKITRNIADKNDPEKIRRVEIEKDGIIALLSLHRNHNEEKWILTGFDNRNKKEEATEAIQTVIARYSGTPEFSYFRKQVGAVVSSLQISPQLNEMSTENKQFQGLQEGIRDYGRDIMSEASNNMTGILTTNKSGIVTHNKFGEITVDAGEAKSRSFGLKHIIKQRHDEKKSTKEISAILILLNGTLKNGEKISDIKLKQQPEHRGRMELEAGGIIAIVSKQRHQGDSEQWVLTGFDKKENKEAADTIQKVISRYGYTPEFLGLEKQVGAVVSSLQISPQLNEKSRKIDTARKTSFKDDNKKYLNSLYNFDILSNILKTGQSQTVENKELGNIYIDKGLNGKKGYGLLHIIEDRTQEGRNDEETSAIIHLVTQAAKEGKITREIPFRDNPKHKGRVELEKDGIIAILSRQRYKGDDEKWILTGFDNKNKKEEATGAIQTVIAQYGRSLEFSGFRNQVGAVVSSLQISHQQNEKSREIETARKAGYVQGVCECVAIIVDNHTLGKKLLTEMKVTKDMAKKFATPETYKTLEKGIFAQKQDQKLEQTQGVTR